MVLVKKLNLCLINHGREENLQGGMHTQSSGYNLHYARKQSTGFPSSFGTGLHFTLTIFI